MNKRLLLAFGLFFVFMLIFQTLFMKQQPQKQKTTAPGPVTHSRPVVKRTSITASKVKAAALEPVSNGLLTVGLSKVDGTVSSIQFAKYKENGKNIDFIEKSIPFLRNFRVLFPGVQQADLQQEVLFAHKKINNLTHQFTHTYKKGAEEGIQVTKTYSFFPEKYYFDLSVTIKNMSGKQWKNPDKLFSLVWGSPVNWRKDKKEGTYDVQKFIYCNSEGNEQDLTDDELENADWIGIKDRYFLFSIIPIMNRSGKLNSNGRSAEFFPLDKEKKKGVISFSFLNKTLVEKQIEGSRFRIFLGPMKYDLLTSDEFENNDYSFSNVLTTFPVVREISILFEKLIFAVHGLVSNFGIVIILVTLILKLVLYPLTHRSVISMKKMQLIQPKIAALKDQMKNQDPRLMNQKMMELYKKEGVNPMGGCLPVLLQLPIFIALYQVLPRLVDMKDVAFLWIKDLSSPDTLFYIPAFKDIPLLPHAFNLLPLIMTAVSIIQSKMSQKSSGPQTAQQAQQNKMMMLMPIMFLFLFWKMPSGLVLYWTLQNIFSIVEQSFINKKYGAKEAASE